MQSEKESFQLKSLTKTSKETGEIYQRRPETAAQIIEFLSLAEAELFGKLRDLKSETLVFLYRENFHSNRKVSEKIWEIFGERILRIARRERVKFDNEADFEDFVGEIQFKLFDGIGNLQSDETDYAQVSFGEFVKGLILNELRKKYVVQRREKQTIWLDEDFEAEDRPQFQLFAQITDAEKILFLRQAFGKLPQEIYEVCYLHYLEGFQIYSQDSQKITLAKIYGKSEKTIRNWLKKAEEFLAAYQGEIR